MDKIESVSGLDEIIEVNKVDISEENQLEEVDCDLEDEDVDAEDESNVIKISVKDFIHENALPYAYYTINDRALISDDGLKPVNRRILYAMYKMGLKSESKHGKAAMIAGDVTGHYHPHGDVSVGDALARMAQWFSLRVPLIDFQGSVGFQTGDLPAKMRYWEARINKAGMELVKDLETGSAKMVRNFSDSGDEPVKLPVRFPVSLINGTQGIAVGYASYIVSHNPDEVMDACISRLDGKLKTIDDLMGIVKGPDFPTGGEVLGLDGVREYMETGKGKFVVRGKYKLEQLSRGRHLITFYELPYQISAEQVITSIKSLQQTKKKLVDIAEVKDLSDRKHGLKLAITVKAGANAKMVIEDLWRLTPCQSNFSVNNTVLLDGRPKVVSVIELIDQFLMFKKENFIRSKLSRKRYIEGEIFKLDGLLRVIIDIDKAISIIRNSEDVDVAKNGLMGSFGIEEGQAEHILKMQLRSLTKADKNDLELKKNKFEDELAHINNMFSNENVLNAEIKEDLIKTKEIISDPRRTVIHNVTQEELQNMEKANIKLEKKLAKDTNCYVVLYSNNKITLSIDKPLGGDYPVREVIKTSSKSELFAVSKDGELKKFSVATIPVGSNVSVGVLGVSEEDFVGITSEKNKGTFVVTSKGNVNITKGGKLKEGKLVSLDDDEYLLYAIGVSDKDKKELNVAILGENGKLSLFPLSLVRSSGQGSGTISGMKGTLCVGGCIVKANEEILTVSKSELKRTKIEIIPVTGRNVAGSMLHKVKGKEDSLCNMFKAELGKMCIIDESGKEVILPEYSDRAVRGDKVDNTHVFAGDKLECTEELCEGEVAKYVDSIDLCDSVDSLDGGNVVRLEEL